MKIIIIFLIFCFGLNVAAKDIKIAVGLSLPPYVIKNKGNGIELDIVKKIFTKLGYKPKLNFVPFGEVKQKLLSGEVDAALTMKADGNADLFFSDNYITYQNVAISLKKNSLSINKVKDLRNHSLAAFQNAKLYLGEDFKKAAQESKSYEEYPKQVVQIRDLYAGNKDVYIGDINIFKFYQDRLGRSYDTTQEISISEVFKPTDYQVGFKSKELRDGFNDELKKLRSSGSYDAIKAKYVK